MIDTLLNRVHLLEEIRDIINEDFGRCLEENDLAFDEEIYDLLESLEILSLFQICEEKYNFQASDSEYDNINTYGDLIDLIIKYGRD